MSILSKARLARVGLRAGCVTRGDPARPLPPPPGFRGRPRFDASRCTGCGGCAASCPAREILVCDRSQEVRVLLYLGRRCTSCGRCAEVCPEGAVVMSQEYALATNTPADLRQRLELFMGTCQRCGSCFRPPSALETLKLKGYRFDDLAAERWVPSARASFPGDPTAEDVAIELEE